MNFLRPIVIVGAGGHGRTVLDTLRSEYEAMCVGSHTFYFLDDVFSGTVVDGVTVVGTCELLSDAKFMATVDVIVAIGNPKVRCELSRKVGDLRLTRAVHPSAVVARGVDIGVGSAVMPNAVLGVGCHVGRFVVINNGATVGHGCKIMDGVSINDGCHFGGDVTVEEQAYLGIGASIMPRITIGARSVVGIGAVVVQDVPPDVTVYGNPAKVIVRGVSS